jgi:hypothetical protein
VGGGGGGRTGEKKLSAAWGGHHPPPDGAHTLFSDVGSSAGAPSSWPLERQTHMGEKVFDGTEEPCDRMTLGGVAQILRRHMQIDLSTRDLAVSEEIANRDEVDAFAHQVRGKGVTQPMRTQRLR